MPDSEAREKRGKTLKCGREEALKVKIYPLGFLKIQNNINKSHMSRYHRSALSMPMR
jgi:hypothetical protein